jgi:hypothetical protein
MCGADIVGWTGAVSAHRFNGDLCPKAWQGHRGKATPHGGHDTIVPTLASRSQAKPAHLNADGWVARLYFDCLPTSVGVPASPQPTTRPSQTVGKQTAAYPTYATRSNFITIFQEHTLPCGTVGVGWAQLYRAHRIAIPQPCQLKRWASKLSFTHRAHRKTSCRRKPPRPNQEIATFAVSSYSESTAVPPDHLSPPFLCQPQCIYPPPPMPMPSPFWP